MERLPVRLYCCPGCDYRTEKRWLLAAHLNRMHGLTKRNAKIVAENNEYLLAPNPRYIRSDEYPVEIDSD
jgi:hypothetical protein